MIEEQESSGERSVMGMAGKSMELQPRVRDGMVGMRTEMLTSSPSVFQLRVKAGMAQGNGLLLSTEEVIRMKRRGHSTPSSQSRSY